MTSSTNVAYKIEENEGEISSFFKQFNSGDWNFDNFYNFRKHGQQNSHTIKQEYHNNLQKIMQLDTIPQPIRRFAGQLLQNSKGKSASTIPEQSASKVLISNYTDCSVAFGNSQSTIVFGEKVSDERKQAQGNDESIQRKKNLFEEDESEVEEETNSSNFRKQVFVAGYAYFKGDLTLQLVRELNILKKGFKPETLGEYLDLLSSDLLSKEMNTNDKNALKLALSRMISCYGPTSTVFDEFFNKQGDSVRKKFEEAKGRRPNLPVGMSMEMKSTFDTIVAASSDNRNELRAVISEIKAKVLREEKCDDEELQLLDVLDHVLLDMKRKCQHSSDLTAYRKTASILDIIFNDTTLTMIDGENCSKATKDVRMDNMYICDDKDDKKTIIGRKINLIMGATGVELGSSEWKKEDTTRKVIEEQSIKNTRTNRAILSKITKMPLNKESENIFVLGMDWLGMVGCIFAVSSFNDAFLVHQCGDLIVPQTFTTISTLKGTLDLLFSFKHHHQDLENIIEPAKEQLKIQSQLSKIPHRQFCLPKMAH